MVMFINMKEIIAADTISDFCSNLEAGAMGRRDIVLDFKGVQEIKSKAVVEIMTTCLKLKESGDVIRLKDMSFMVRDQFLLSAINYAGDEILL